MIETLKTKLSHILVILLAFLVACTPVASQVPTLTGEAQALPTVESSPTAAVIPAPAPNILNIGSASEIPLPAYKRQCVENILRPVPDTEAFKGTLTKFSSTGVAVFTQYFPGNTDAKTAIILFDLRNGTKLSIPADLASEAWADSPKVSPDRKWLFYLTGLANFKLSDSKFALANSKGEIVKTFPVSIVKSSDYYYLFVHEWLGNDSLRLLSKKDRESKDLVVLSFDPFTEKITKLQNDFNGLQSPIVKYAKTPQESHQYLDWGIDPFRDVILSLLNGANVAYSPDTNLAFYPHHDGYSVLYDVKNQKELAHVSIPNWGELIKWSPTGDYVSFIANPSNTSDTAKKDFYLLSRDGKTLKRLTYLSQQFDRLSIKQYSWSPDGTKIAFWLNTNSPQSEEEQVTYELAVVNVMNGNITNYCIPNQRDQLRELTSESPLEEPVWSPDGNQLLIPTRTLHKTRMYTYDLKTLLFDPSKLSAMEIMNLVTVGGWMSNGQ